MRNSIICLAALALLLGAGYAADEEAAAKKPPWLSLTIDPAWQLLMPEGNRARAGHYLVPFSAPYFGIESLDVRTRGGFDWVDLSLARIPGRPFDTRAGLWLPGLPGYVKGRWDKSVFFEEPLFPAPLQSGRSNQGYDVLLMPLPGLQFTGGWHKQNVAYPSQLRDSGIAWRSETYTGGINIPLGHRGSLSFDVESLKYTDLMTAGLTGTTDSYSLGWEQALGMRFVLGAQMRWAKIKETGRASSDLFTANVGGLYMPAKNVTLQAGWRMRDVNLRPTSNGYVTKQGFGSASLTWRLKHDWTFRTSFESGGMERFSATQATVDHPQETRFRNRLEWRGPRSLRASASWLYRTTDGLDNTSVPNVPTPFSLLPDEQHKIDLRLSGMVGKGGLAYGFWQYDLRRTSARAETSVIGTLGAGTTFPIGPRVNWTGDLFYRYITSNLPALSGTDGDGLVFHTGLGVGLSRHCQMMIDYNHVEGYLSDNADANYIAAGLDWNLGKDRSVRLGWHREDYTNGAFSGLGYATDIVDVGYRAKY